MKILITKRIRAEYNGDDISQIELDGIKEEIMRVYDKDYEVNELPISINTEGGL